MVSRRSTLKWFSAVGLAGASGTWWWRSRPIKDVPTSAPLDAPVEFDQTIGVRTSPVGLNPLRIPPLLEGEASGTEREFNLQLQEGLTRFLLDLDTPTLGFNGSYLGPTLRLRTGEPLAINVSNGMQEATTVHWHGLHVPAKQDGGPHQVLVPGADWRVNFTLDQKASTCWYHSHMFHMTGRQVYMGLAGLIIVDDDESGTLGLPSAYGVDDIPLILQDRAFAGDGSLAYPTDVSTLMRGVRGDTLLVNGTLGAYIDVSHDKIRFRILNGANARTFTLAFSDGRPFQLIAGDSSFLESPLTVTQVMLAVAERAEIVVSIAPGEELQLVNLPVAPLPRSYTGLMNGMMRTLDQDPFDVLLIRAAATLTVAPAIATTLTQIERLRAEDATVTRKFILEMGNGPGNGGGREGRGAGGGGNGGGNGGGYGGGIFKINGNLMNMNRINFEVKDGTTEIWVIENQSPMIHPFHIHKVAFQILDRNGVPPPPEERGLKDTVRVHIAETVRVIARFEDFPDPQTPYMYHCHILEHEDHGMMGQFVVV